MQVKRVKELNFQGVKMEARSMDSSLFDKCNTDLLSEIIETL
jgi:hypothetical protein